MLEKRSICFVLVSLVLISRLAAFGDPPQTASVIPLSDRTWTGAFRVDLLTGSESREVGRLEYSAHFSEQAMELDRSLIDEHGTALRFTQEGGGASHMDALYIDGSPLLAVGATNFEKLSAADFDVIRTDRVFTVSPAEWGDAQPFGRSPSASPSESPIGPLRLSMTARIEGEVISTEPFRFPAVNTFRNMGVSSASFKYRIDSVRGGLQVDGELRNERLGAPLFNASIPVGSGHPQGATVGWVRNDDKFLYAAIDFTPDNTIDDGKDYAALYAFRRDEVVRFPISASDRTWGEQGFTYTDLVGYQHMVYEFAIPLTELTVDDTGITRIAFETYGTATPVETRQPLAIAYDSVSNQYGVFFNYSDSGGGVNDEIRGQLFDSSAAAIGAMFIIETLDEILALSSSTISAAFDPFDRRYLVAWDYYDTTSADRDIRGQLVNHNGTLFGGVVTISDLVGEDRQVDVAYDSVNERFLVVWSRLEADEYEIVGRVFDSNGTAITTIFPISSVPGANAAYPSASFDPVNEQYLVVLEDNRSGGYQLIYGQIVDVDGSLIGTDEVTNILIAGSGYGHYEPRTEYAEAANGFLVVWTTSGNQVEGKILLDDGTIYDLDGDLIPETIGDYVEIAPVGDSSGAAWNRGTDEGIVVWHRFVGAATENDVEGQVVLPDLSLSGGTVVISGVANDELSPVVASNSFDGTAAVAYVTTDFDTTNVQALSVSVVGTSAPDPGLAWSGGDTGGVDPDSAVSGSTFTFTVDYFSVSENPPITAELWIDVDGDGTFTDPAGTTPIAPIRRPPSGRPDRFSMAFLSIGVALLALGMRARRHRPSRRRGGSRLALFVALGSIMLVLASCRLYVGVGTIVGTNVPLGTLPDLPNSQEIYPMSETDPGDTTFSDGKTYSVDVVIEGYGRQVPYRFVFSDGVSEAIGYGASEMRVSVTD